MSIEISDTASSNKIVLNKSTSDLKEWIQSNNFSCDLKMHISPCDPYFWLTSEERSKLRGAIGCTGPIGAYGCTGAMGQTGSKNKLYPPIDNREHYADKNVIVKISFNMVSNRSKEICETKLYVTHNELGDAIDTWKYYPKCVEKTYPCGIYPKKGFHEAYNAMKVLKPNLTIKEFAYDYNEGCWDEDLVTIKTYSGLDDCLEIIPRAIEYVDTGESRVTLSLLMCDIEPNMDYIKTVLSSFIG